MKLITFITTITLMATSAFAHEKDHVEKTSPYDASLTGEFVGGYFRPDGVVTDNFIPNTDFIYSYISENSPLDKKGDPIFTIKEIKDPVVVFLNNSQLEIFAGKGMGSAVAIYEEGYMYLNESIDLSTTEDYSILMHELIHHVQRFSGQNEVYKECPISLEKDAYNIQIKWLKEQSADPEWIYAMNLSKLMTSVPCYPDRPFY